MATGEDFHDFYRSSYPRLVRRAGGTGAVAALLAALVAVPLLLPERPPGPATPPAVTGPPGSVLDRVVPWNRWPDTPVVGHTDVRGVRAEIDADGRDANLNVRWREGDRGYVVTGHVRYGTDPRRVGSLVVGIARGLRRPCEPPPAVVLDSYPPQYREAGGGTRPDQSGCR